MFIFFRGEKFKDMVFFHSENLQKLYKISNFGCIISHTPGLKDFKLIKLPVISGFNVFRYKIFRAI